MWQRQNLNAQATAPRAVSLSIVKPKQSDSTPQHQEISQFLDVVPLEYEVVEWTATEGLKDALYESYRPQRVRIKDALPHPSLLCESAALALVSPPAPTYKPHLPQYIVAQGLLSEAQLESVVYAGLAHSGFLTGSYLVDDSLDNVTVAANNEQNAVRFRRGWFLGDSTGSGKGRREQCENVRSGLIINYIAIFSIKPGLFRCDRIPKYPISVLGFSTSQNRIAPGATGCWYRFR